MAETIPQDVRKLAAVLTRDLVGRSIGHSRAQSLAVRAIMADRASRTPDRDVLVEALRDVIGELAEAEDKFWIAHLNFPVTAKESFTKQRQAQDKEFLKSMSERMKEARNRARPALPEREGLREAAQQRICPYCQGSGQVMEIYGPTGRQVTTCEHCNGEGIDPDYRPAVPAERGVEEPRVELGPDGKEWAKTEAGYRHVESVLASSAEGPAGRVWYGHAIREAFVAGAEWQEGRAAPPPPAGMVPLTAELVVKHLREMKVDARHHGADFSADLIEAAISNVEAAIRALAAAPGQPAQGDGT